MHRLKFFCFYAALLFFAGTAGWAGVRIHRVVSHSWMKPALVCDEPVFDFGTIETDQELVHEFVLRVEGQRPVTILGVFPGCGSHVKVINFSKEPIPVGSEIKVVLKLPTIALTGKKSQRAVLRTDDPASSALVLTMNVNYVEHRIKLRNWDIYLISSVFVENDST